MFICQVCRKVSKSGEKCNLITTARKMIQHLYRPYAHKFKNLLTDRTEYNPDEGGKGYQIVREIKACGNCKSYSPELSI